MSVGNGLLVHLSLAAALSTGAMEYNDPLIITLAASGTDGIQAGLIRGVLLAAVSTH